MTLNAEIILEILALLGTALAGVWYVANTVSRLQAQIDKLETKMNAHMDSMRDVPEACRVGRVQIWEALNQERMKTAEIKARIDAEREHRHS